MSNPIPPFVCNTPPPIDCIADAPPPLVEDDFGDFAVVDDHQFEVSSLPVTPVHVAKLPDITPSVVVIKESSPPPLPDSVYDFPPEDKTNGTPIDNNNSFTKETTTISSFYPPSNASKADVKNDLPYIIEANSPPPFEYVPEDDDDLPQCVELDDDEEPDEFPVDDDMGKYDDNISLPSLKFDSLSNHSKSTTPVSDEQLAKPKLEEPETIPKIDVDVAEVIDVKLVMSSTDRIRTPDEELNSVPIESLNIADELEKCDDINLSQLSEEQEDDFAEFEAFPTPLVSNDIPKIQEEPRENDLPVKEVIDDNNTEPVFEADFSQFSSFATETVAPPVVTSQIIENSQFTEKSTLDDLEADDFDDFQDFTVPSTTTEERKASVYSASSEVAEDPTETIKNSEEDDNEDEDDDFGEFSEVVETNEASSIPSSNSGFNLANLNEKLKPILDMMFPVANPNDQKDEEAPEYTPSDLNDLNQLTAINQIDTAKALEHQWINSEVRHSLIKSLGVDSRNILYGEKWNSSMPRYAANLSFNPLEPMKSDKSTNNSSSSTNTTDYRKRSDSLTSTSTKTDVPAVEFDWNSSGLVNPLDGVKEILHERTIETLHTTQPGESNAPTDQQSSTTLKSNNNNINTNNNNVYDSDKSLRCFIDDEETISTPIEFKSNADAPVAISTAAPTATTIITAPTTLSGDYIDITGNEFQSSVLETNLDTITATSQQVLNHNTTHAAKYQESLKTDLETESQHSGVVSTSTYAGPLKETHIFTPSKGENILSTTRSSSSTAPIKTPRTSESNKCPIDFDYEIAAAGIIIDETVVKKEYRDVEYNPGFGSKYREDTIEHNHRLSPEIGLSKHNYHSNDLVNSREPPRNQLDDARVIPDKNIVEKIKPSVPNSNSFDDEFSDFQSVPPPAPVPLSVLPTIVPSTIIPSSVVAEPKSSPSHWRVLKETAEVSSLNSRTGTPVSLNDEMILCPAILLPQAIQMESKPKIEWPEPGINPEELARIEELFPQPKGSSNKPSPSHSGRSQQNASNRATPQLNADDDDWSDFVSVPAAATNHIQSISQQFQKRQVSPAKSASDPNNDDEWSDFVSSAPPPQNNMRPSVYPQFNSASWQNANFYNNPMSAYASPPTSFYYQPPAPQQNLSNNLVPNLSNLNNNTAQPPNNNIINNNSINQYLINNQANHLNHHHQQHIQMMRDFSSASPMDGGSLSSTTPSMHHQYSSMQSAPGYGYSRGLQQQQQHHHPQQHGKSSQFGSGSSKIAPSISLIPDLGFVAPAHTSFISVPKNSFATKK
ncbi:homeobox protein 5 isoform X2 [Episyrphus balteatus]|uniref:homeobox protein 5 isoform X2 n=1 Tax=Episyrphus balteatus TaxID=286459 RepID=UPI00248580FF|nr:homeobox protein 5 isoform X2 [Episyrphus balteatus]